MTTDRVLAHLARRLPDFRPAGEPEPLSGGLLNRVWRVRGEPDSVIVKHAPDRVGGLPLDPSRIGFEARALGLLGPGGDLHEICDRHVKPPGLFDFDAASHTLVMEDVGALPPLDVWLESTLSESAARAGAWLGTFIGRLHAQTTDQPDFATRFTNLPIQRTRLDVQYRGIGTSLKAAGVTDAGALGARAGTLGERLLRPGRCLVMGDLWPRSVLVGSENLSIIDWEMVHFGQPFQDIAHLAAHLWMLAHRGVPKARDFARGFSNAYEAAAPPEQPGEAADAALHAGCEIVVRALGPFRGGYVYDDFAPDSLPVREAIAHAAEWMRGGVRQRRDLFG